MTSVVCVLNKMTFDKALCLVRACVCACAHVCVHV